MTDQNTEREEAREWQRQVQEKMRTAFNRALDDSQFRDSFLNNPRSVLGDGQGSAPEMPDEFKRHRKELLTAVLTRADADPQFRSRFEREPAKTMREDFGPQMEQLRAALPTEEVRGYGWFLYGNWTVFGGGSAWGWW